MGRIGGAWRRCFSRRGDRVRIHYPDVGPVDCVKADLGLVFRIGVNVEPPRAAGIDGVDLFSFGFQIYELQDERVAARFADRTIENVKRIFADRPVKI